MKTYAPDARVATTPLFAQAVAAFLDWQPFAPEPQLPPIPISEVFELLRDNGRYVALASLLARRCVERGAGQ